MNRNSSLKITTRDSRSARASSLGEAGFLTRKLHLKLNESACLSRLILWFQEYSA
jgi:hypothetical protein